MKLLTIVIPAYNVQDYIGECLNSVVNQTSLNFNIVIVNDGSTDEHTAEICSAYVKKYPDLITYIYQNNKGLGAARNTGMKYVRTPWVAFLDSDDWIVPNYVERFEIECGHFESRSIDIFFTLPTIYENTTHNCLDWYDKDNFEAIFYSGTRVVNPQVEKRLYCLEVNACRRIYNVDFLKRLNFSFPEGVKWEDVYPHFYLLSNAYAVAGIKDIGFYYRVGTSGQITASTGKGRLDMIKVFAQTFQYLLSSYRDYEVIMIAIQTLMNFARWSLDVADITTRKELVDKLSELFKLIPSEYLNDYKKQHKENKELINSIMSPVFRWTQKDYLTKVVCVKLIKKLRRNK